MVGRLSVVVLCFAVQIGAASLSAQSVAIIDAETKTLALTELSSGKIQRQVALADPPTRLLITPDKSKYVVLSRGTGKTDWLDKFQPTTKGSATIVDAKSLTLLSRHEVGWGEPGDAFISSDSTRLFALSSGTAKLTASLHAIDLTEGKAIGAVNWTRNCDGYPNPRCGLAVSADETRGVVFFQGYGEKQTLLSFVDLPAAKEATSVAIKARTEAPVAVGDTFYLLDPPMRAGTLYAVSFSKEALSTQWPVGISAKIAAVDSERGLVYVTSQSAQRGTRGANGQLQVFRGVEEVASLKIGDYPRAARLSPDGKTLFVISETQLTTVSTDDWKATMTKTGAPYMNDVVLSPDGSRAYFFLAREEVYCCGLATWDVAAAKKIKDVGLGSSGWRIADALAAVAASVESYKTNKAAAKASGKSAFHYSLYAPRVASAASAAIHVRSNGKSVYAVDPQTGNLTHVDAITGEVKKNIPLKGAAYSIVPLGDGSTLLTVGSKGVGVVDANREALHGEWMLAGGEKIRMWGAGVAPDGRSAILMSNAGARGVTVDGKLLPLIEGSKNVVDYLFVE